MAKERWDKGYGYLKENHLKYVILYESSAAIYDYELTLNITGTIA